jgi:GNAT superfamily N-acetyltransferase
VAEHERQLRARELAVDDVQVGPADAARADAQQHLPCSGRRLGELLAPERRPCHVEHQCPHDVKLQAIPGAIGIRRLARNELALIRGIDRSERIDALYVQRAGSLELLTGGDWSAPAWSRDDEGEHSVAAQRRACEELVDAGAIAFGAFTAGRLVGIGVVRPHLRPDIAQLAYLQVTRESRSRGVGGRLADELERLARDVGSATMVVSATPSANTVRFYLGRGYEPMAEPLPELVALEPEDVQLSKVL